MASSSRRGRSPTARPKLVAAAARSGKRRRRATSSTSRTSGSSRSSRVTDEGFKRGGKRAKGGAARKRDDRKRSRVAAGGGGGASSDLDASPRPKKARPTPAPLPSSQPTTGEGVMDAPRPDVRTADARPSLDRLPKPPRGGAGRPALPSRTSAASLLNMATLSALARGGGRAASPMGAARPLGAAALPYEDEASQTGFRTIETDAERRRKRDDDETAQMFHALDDMDTEVAQQGATSAAAKLRQVYAQMRATSAASDAKDDGGGSDAGRAEQHHGGGGGHIEDDDDGGDDGAHARQRALAPSIIAALCSPPDGKERQLSTEHVLLAKNYLLKYWLVQRQLDVNGTTVTEDDDPLLFAAIRLGVRDAYVKRSLTHWELKQAFLRAMLARLRLEVALRERHVMVSNTQRHDRGHEHAADFTNLQIAMRVAYMLLLAWRDARNVCNPGEAAHGAAPQAATAALHGVVGGRGGGGGGGGMAEMMLQANQRNFNLVYKHLLQEAMSRGLRRYGDLCYEQVMSPPMRADAAPHAPPRQWPTHAWRPVVDPLTRKPMDIATFVREATKKELYPDMFELANPGQTYAVLAHRLEHAVDPEFSQLVFNRHLHAFRNGLFDKARQVFYHYSDPRLPSDAVAVKYHDADFDPNFLDVPYMLVPTPAFDRVLDTQFAKMPPAEAAATKHIFYAMLGRTGWEAGSDDWQVSPVLLGLAGTGKSLCLDVAAMQYPSNLVGTISPHAQEQFGLETIYDKYLWIMPEIGKGKEGLSQYDFQSMTSAENVSVGRKNKTELTVRWTVPGIMAGNMMPRWMDAQGSLARRLMMFLFEVTVPPSQHDATLKEQLHKEFPAILYKMSAAYLALRSRFGHTTLWGQFPRRRDGKLVPILPPPLFKGRMRARELSNPLVLFLNTTKLVKLQSTDTTAMAGIGGGGGGGGALDDAAKRTFSMPFKRFQELAQAFFEENGVKSNTFKWQVRGKGGGGGAGGGGRHGWRLTPARPSCACCAAAAAATLFVRRAASRSCPTTASSSTRWTPRRRRRWTPTTWATSLRTRRRACCTSCTRTTGCRASASRSMPS